MDLDEILLLKKPDELIQALVEYVVEPEFGGVGPMDLANAPPMVLACIFIRAFDSTITNSGIYKWLIEIENGDPDVAGILESIGALKASHYIRSAMKIFPRHKVPDDLHLRFEICERHASELRQLDRNYEGAPTDAILRLKEHIVHNRNAFESEVKQFWNWRRRHAA